MSLETFTTAYIAAALWSSTPDGTEWLRENLALETRAKMEADCRSFWSSYADLIETHGTASYAGHDFWLTRCGHGAGFWDGDWPDAVSAILTDASEQFGNVDLYEGDDGLIWA
jgi:hypothetical protein